jgi:hypothetical protein
LITESNSFMGFHYGLWAAASAVFAIVFYFKWPRPVNDINSRPLWRHLILRWGQSLVWVMIGVSFLLRLAFSAPYDDIAADGLALTAIIFYLVYLGVGVIDMRAPN